MDRDNAKQDSETRQYTRPIHKEWRERLFRGVMLSIYLSRCPRRCILSRDCEWRYPGNLLGARKGKSATKTFSNVLELVGGEKLQRGARE
jgi:hypothetical protein